MERCATFDLVLLEHVQTKTQNTSYDSKTITYKDTIKVKFQKAIADCV